MSQPRAPLHGGECHHPDVQRSERDPRRDGGLHRQPDLVGRGRRRKLDPSLKAPTHHPVSFKTLMVKNDTQCAFNLKPGFVV